MNRTLILFAIVAVVSGCQQRQTMFPQGTWHDLSYDFSEETIYWPTADTFKREKVFYGLTELGYFYSANNFSAAEHGGTHLDSPIHFSSGRITADKIPLERLIFKPIEEQELGPVNIDNLHINGSNNRRRRYNRRQ